MIAPARIASYHLLSLINDNKVFSDDALNSETIEKLEIRDRHFATELVYGSLRLQGTLDHILAQLISIPWRKVEPGAKILLRMGLYQLWQMDRVPDHAIVNDAVELAKKEIGKGIDRFINAILRRLTRERLWEKEGFLLDAPLWVRCALPEWLWRRWSGRFGEKAALAYASSLNKPPQSAFYLLDAEAEKPEMEFIASDIVPGALIRIASPEKSVTGLHYQDEGSQLIPYLMGAVEGWKVWDSCAAPGGKAAILKKICGDSGCVVASDLKWERIARLRELMRDPLLVVADAGKPAPFRASFDGALADVPCSGLGTLRRNPEIKWRFMPGDFSFLHQTQLRILEAVSEAVKVGGRLLYSTCSTEPEENEQVVENFLKKNPGFRKATPSSPIGISNWIGSDGYVRTFPGERLWDGFFAALLIRES
jgi:16S rRNA (cytosine967-C5)-methyltransferase